jgi:hypothetical protein
MVEAMSHLHLKLSVTISTFFIHHRYSTWWSIEIRRDRCRDHSIIGTISKNYINRDSLSWTQHTTLSISSWVKCLHRREALNCHMKIRSKEIKLRTYLR